MSWIGLLLLPAIYLLWFLSLQIQQTRYEIWQILFNISTDIVFVNKNFAHLLPVVVQKGWSSRLRHKTIMLKQQQRADVAEFFNILKTWKWRSSWLLLGALLVAAPSLHVFGKVKTESKQSYSATPAVPPPPALSIFPQCFLLSLFCLMNRTQHFLPNIATFLRQLAR